MMNWIIANAWPISFLTIAVVDDIVYKKFHNALFLILAASALFYIYFLSPLSWHDSLTGGLIGAALLIPLVLLGVIGAGDMKFMIAFGLLVGFDGALWTVCYSLAWGSIIGLLKATFDGQIVSIFKNLSAVLKRQEAAPKTHIPYTVAFVLGWLTWLQMGGLS